MRARRVASMSVATVLLAVGIGAPASAQAPSARLDVVFAPGSPAPPVLNQLYRYAVEAGNDGDVPLDNLVIVDTLPVELTLSQVTTGSYTGLSEFAAGEGVRVSYEKNTALGVFTLWGSSPNTTTNTTLTAPPPGLGAGEYITRVRWEYGQAEPGMQASAPPQLAGRVTNPDNAGGPVAVGDTIANCAALTAVYTAGATAVTRNACRTFALIAGPGIAIQAPDSTPLGSPAQATATLSGGDPTGSITFRVFAANDSMCTTPLTTQNVPIDGVGAYPSTGFTAAAAGAYKWVAGYNGDVLHAASATACNDPAGAFAVVAPPQLSAAFGATAIDVGGSTRLTFTISNPPANTVSLTGVGFPGPLPIGLVVASYESGCGGAFDPPPSGRDFFFERGTVAVGSSCTFSLDVTGTAAGPKSFLSGPVASANGGIGNAATAFLTVRRPTETTLSCGEVVTVGEEATCTATVRADVLLPEGTVGFATDGTGTYSADACTLQPVSGTAATCEVRYTPSGDVPEAGRQDTITAEYAPADTTTWTASEAEAMVTVRPEPALPPPAPPAPPAGPVTPRAPQSAQELALACSPANLVLISATEQGRRVRLRGGAAAADAGKHVTIRILTGDAVVARATVLPDGSFRATARRPRGRLVNKTRYYAQLGERRSPTLKLTRRLTARATISAGNVTIRGRVSPPLGKPIRRVVIWQLTNCSSGYAVVARVRPDARGRFRITLPGAAGAEPALFRARTSVPHRGRSGTLRTFSLALGVDPTR